MNDNVVKNPIKVIVPESLVALNGEQGLPVQVIWVTVCPICSFIMLKVPTVTTKKIAWPKFGESKTTIWIAMVGPTLDTVSWLAEMVMCMKEEAGINREPILKATIQ